MISVKHLTKQYGGHTAVSDLSFEIKKGQIYGFLGPNGAGKSTTMNIMTGCLGATSGDVTIGGYDIFEEPDKAKRLIGYLPEQPPLYLDRTPREYLTFVARAKRIPKDQIQAQIAHAMEVTQITDVENRLIKHLSKGYKQRVGIAQAILGDPDVIILDEPTVGLDPRQMIEIRQLIRDLGKEHTVILSSHILSEVQAVCQVILIISKGKLVACDTPENLEKLFAGTVSVRLIVENRPEELERLREILDAASYITDVQSKPLDDFRMQLHIDTNADNEVEVCRALFFAFSEAGWPILQMTTAKASLEDVFIELTGSNETDDAAEETKEPLEENPAEANAEPDEGEAE